MRSTSPSLLKLFALPLSRSSPSHPPLFLLHAHKPRSTLPPTQSQSQSENAPKLPLLTKATDKAADMWSQLGKGAPNSWKKKSYNFGEKMMDKIEFEEWALKAIDTNLAPKPFDNHSHSTTTTTTTSSSSNSMYEPVELIFPQSLLKSKHLLEQLEKQLKHREPHHRKAMWKCLILAPFTTPFALLPVVPNFPLFYVLWRAWSHWRAHKSSSYLLSLLSSPSSNLTLSPSSRLDSIYAPLPPRDDHSDSQLLLTLDQVDKLTKEFGLDFEEKKELERAVGQAEERLKQGRSRDYNNNNKDDEVIKKEVQVVGESFKEEDKK